MRLPTPARWSLLALAVVVAATGAATAVRPDRPAAAVTPAYTASSLSWNRNISCKAVVTTLAAVLGNQRSSAGGASFAGGGLRPGVPDRRATKPPCTAGGTPTLVELHGVTAGACSTINKDGDWTCIVSDPRSGRRIHVETGRNVRALGDWSVPAAGTRIDVQGFVFWDPDHVGAGWHDHTGWELHSLTAWRRAA